MKKFITIAGILLLVITTSSVSSIIWQEWQKNTNKAAQEPNTVTEQSVQNLRSYEQEIINVVDTADDAVVSVIITKDMPIIEQYFEEGTSPYSKNFEQFFGFSPYQFQVPLYRQNGTEQREIGGGTAFFISADGLLLTNKHVIDDEGADYTILLNDERRLEAKVVATDPLNDIAMLQVEGNGFNYLELETQTPKLGQTAIAIGNALAEFRNTVSIGVVSGLQRSLTAGSTRYGQLTQLEEIIQTDTAINQGNSGGPLLNSVGKVIGMNTAVAANAQNIGFAIPAGDLARAVASYKTNGSIQRAYLGVRYVQITPDIQTKNNLEYDYGVLITTGETSADVAVEPNSPADKAGLQENDIILEVDNVKLTNENSFSNIIGRSTAGTIKKLTIVRNKEIKEINVTLEGK